MRLLLAHASVDPNQAQQHGYTPLGVAAMHNQEATVRLLLAHPAVDAERANQNGRTPLLAACMTRNTAATLALLEAKADPNARASNGDSPLVVARRGDNAQLLAALVAAGAVVTALYPPFVAKCMLGDAHAARSLLLGSASAARAFQVLEIDEGLAGVFRSFDADRSDDMKTSCGAAAACCCCPTTSGAPPPAAATAGARRKRQEAGVRMAALRRFWALAVYGFEDSSPSERRSWADTPTHAYALRAYGIGGHRLLFIVRTHHQ